MTSCPQCAAEVPDEAKFCQECGTRVAVRACPSCGAAAERGRFCNSCGAALEGEPGAAARQSVQTVHPVAERRVTSVLFGDLVGFTPLSESKDSEDVREHLSAYFQQCRVMFARYGGVIEKFIGDAVMAVWGVAAHGHFLRGLVALARDGDPGLAESDMRAGIEALNAFGASGYRAQAQEDLARWLVEQRRPEDAAALIDAARTTYTEIGATGWQSRLDSWHSSRQPAHTQ